MFLLLVTIGVINVLLGFGLAVYYGYGPPSWEGILQTLGPMPPAAPPLAPLATGPLGATYIPAETTAPAAALAEEGVLGEVHEMSAALQTAMTPDPANA